MIGTRLFEEISRLGYDAIGVDREVNRWASYLNKRTVIKNLLKEEELEDLPKDIHLVIHLAANASVCELVKNPKMALENIITTFNVMEFLRLNGIKKVIFASSRETYGNIATNSAVNEDMLDVRNCESPYSASKISGECLVHSYCKIWGIDFVIIRFSNVYGMYDDSDRVIPLWIKQTLNGQDLSVYGENKVLDFIYLDDAIDGIIEAIERFHYTRNNTFNIASGKGTKLLYVAEKIRELLRKKNSIIINNERLGEVKEFTADIEKAKRILGFEPKIELDQGLEKTVEWYQKFYLG
jgi:UDP-glucose 4-epimerase